MCLILNTIFFSGSQTVDFGKQRNTKRKRIRISKVGTDSSDSDSEPVASRKKPQRKNWMNRALEYATDDSSGTISDQEDP